MVSNLFIFYVFFMQKKLNNYTLKITHAERVAFNA